MYLEDQGKDIRPNHLEFMMVMMTIVIIIIIIIIMRYHKETRKEMEVDAGKISSV